MGSTVGAEIQIVKRYGILLDPENLLIPFKQRGMFPHGLEVLAAELRSITAGGLVGAGVAVCNRSMTRQVAFTLNDIGIRTFSHGGGQDAADSELLRRSDEVARSCDTVVIGSGDNIFSTAAVRIQSMNKRVIVLGLRGHVSAALRLVSHEVHVITLDSPSYVA